MTAPVIDLRSDTVTRPTAAMREAIAHATVGDDVLGDDPTVKELEAEVAALFRKEAALFVSSGTMGNQIAIALHTRHGDEVIVGEGAHVVFYESAAGAALSGVQFAVAGSGGLFDADAMEERIQPIADWAPRSRLVCLENTHNRAGGRLFPQRDAEAIAERARAHGLGVHLDGARIWNASAASGIDLPTLVAPFDTVSVCFSKGLGAPVGSALLAPKSWIERARVVRKRWGGGMRQSGILAAGALHALRHHRDRLVDDHANARRFADAVAGIEGLRVERAAIETNIVNVDVVAPLRADDIARRALALGLAINPSGPQRLRAVTHLDVDGARIDAASAILARAVDAAKDARS